MYATAKFQYPNDLGCRSKVSLGLPICLQYYHLANGLFVCFVALRPKSTAMVMAERSVHLTTLFPGQALQAVNQYFVHILSLVTDNNPF